MSAVQIKTLVREISNTIGELESAGIECKLSVIWLDVDSVRVVVSVACDDLTLIDASLTGTPERPELLVDLLSYLRRLAQSQSSVF